MQSRLISHLIPSFLKKNPLLRILCWIQRKLIPIVSIPAEAMKPILLWQTLCGIYGTDVLIATGNSFTGNVLKAGYTEKMAGNMIMPNELSAYSSEMSGAELKETVRNFVEGYQGGFIPFNRGSLPVFSGISVEIRETDNGYTLSKVTKNGKQIQDKDTFTVTCLAAPQYMEAYPAEENIVFDGGDTSVEDTWITYVSDGNAILAEPEDYITLR